jgi:hypothetical protein
MNGRRKQVTAAVIEQKHVRTSGTEKILGLVLPRKLRI